MKLCVIVPSVEFWDSKSLRYQTFSTKFIPVYHLSVILSFVSDSLILTLSSNKQKKKVTIFSSATRITD